MYLAMEPPAGPDAAQTTAAKVELLRTVRLDEGRAVILGFHRLSSIGILDTNQGGEYCRFRNRATKYVGVFGITRPSGGAKR